MFDVGEYGLFGSGGIVCGVVIVVQGKLGEGVFRLVLYGFFVGVLGNFGVVGFFVVIGGFELWDCCCCGWQVVIWQGQYCLVF